MQRRSKWIMAALAVLGLVFGAWGARSFAAPPAAPGAAPGAPARVQTNPQVFTAVRSDVSPALRDIRPVPPVFNMSIPTREHSRLKPLTGGGPDTAIQNVFSPLVMPTPIANFEGIYNLWGGYPPDTDGDIGPNHFVQFVNVGFQVFSRTGVSLYGPANGNTLWRGFGGPCEVENAGDPIVLYDPLADRWLMSQFTSQGAPYYECVALSTGPDPTGSYYRYAFLSPQSRFPDYPKLGVWPDGYYMSSNEFAPGFVGAGLFAFERDRMLQGDPGARLVYFHLGAQFGGLLPSDLDGPPPPAGAPNYFLEWDTTTQLAMFRFDVDWAVPANSTLTGPVNIPVTAFTAAGGVPQPGTSVTLASLSDRLMFRLAYRNFGTHESLVVNHSVNAGGVAGIRWYELRNPNGSPPTVYQEGTFTLADGTHRWMGSIAQDRMGDIAAMYSASSSALFPSIRYAGRLVTDPLGQFSQGEGTLIAGTGSQTGTGARWGDYSFLGVDPTDDCTFWGTTEYIALTGERTWRTRIGSFRFPSCVPATPPPAPSATGGVPTNTPTPGPSSTPCAGSVSYTGSITNTDLVQTSRLLSAGLPPASCAVPRACPGNDTGDTTQHRYDQYSYTNSSGVAQCVTVNITPGCSNNALISLAYLGSYDPTNKCLNYIAHGGRGGPQYSYSFTLGAGQTAVVMLYEQNGGVGCENYTLRINPCAGGGGTATPGATNTPVATATTAASPTPNPCALAWATAAPFPVVKGRAVGVNWGNSIYTFGGRPDGTLYTTDVYRYDLITNTWTLLPQAFPDMQSSNMAGGALTFPEGQRIFVVGGNGAGSTYTGRAVAFDPATGAFTPKTAWPATPTRLPGGWAVVNNKFYILGGIQANAAGTAFADIWSYDPTTNAWTQSSANLSLARGYIATEVMPDGLIYVAGGSQNNAGVLTDETIFEKFNPTTNTISTGPPLPTATSNNHGYNVGGKFWVPGGTFTAVSTLVQVYDPATNSWSVGPPLVMAVRNYSKGYGLSGGIHAIGGTDDGGAFYDVNQRLAPSGCVTPSPTVGVATPTRTTVAVTPTPCTITFTDVDQNNPFYVFIRCLACRQIVSGYADGTFRWGNNVTRAQLSKIISGAAGQTTAIPSSQQTFEDVPNSNTFWIFIERLSGVGAISGYACGGPGEPCGAGNRPYFRWGNNATRGQISKITAVTAGWNGPIPTTQQTFTDVPPTNPFWTWIEELASRQIISGYTCGGPGEPCDPQSRPYFRWGNNATRGQMSKIAAESFFPGCVTPAR